MLPTFIFCPFNMSMYVVYYNVFVKFKSVILSINRTHLKPKLVIFN